jgi:hypothetical protein
VLALLAGLPTDARGFRQYRQIASPAKARKLPKGAKAVEKTIAIPEQVLAKAIRQIMASWNKNGFAANLDKDLYNRRRLLDNMDDDVPPDARIRVIAIRGVRIVQQYTTPNATVGKQDVLTCIVSATVRTQIEYNDAKKGFQRIDGTNQYILRIALEPSGSR